MSFGSRNITAYEYRISGLVLKRVHTYKDLGVITDSKLRCHEHIMVVAGKVGGLMNDLLQSTVCRSKKFMLTLFVSHIRSIIDYCFSV